MAPDNFEVEGRTFYIKSDYEAALRDKAVISQIYKKYDINDENDVIKIYNALQNHEILFESLVGQDFDDKIFELVQSIHQNRINGDSVPGSGHGAKQREKKFNAKKSKKSFDDSNPAFKKEVYRELKKRNFKRKLLIALCSGIAVVCIGYFVLYQYYLKRTEQNYSSLSDLKSSIHDSSDDYFRETQIHLNDNVNDTPILEEYRKLYNKNKSLIGWLKIADTDIDYPVMQTSNNEYYLDHNLNQKFDKNGSIFLDKDCDVLKPSTNLILYGHHMKSGRMFGSLDRYSSESYYKKHPVIEFDTIYKKGTWEILYVFRSEIYDSDEIVFKYYQFIDANSEDEFDSNMYEMSKLSLYDTGIKAHFGDELLTLSTCDYTRDDGRFVVVAKRIR